MLFHRRKNKQSRRAEEFRLSREAEELIDEEFPNEDDAYLRQKRRKRRRFLFRLAIVCIAVIALNYAVLVFSGVIKVNEPRKRDYPARGAVVSDRLGEIKWGTLANRNMSYVIYRPQRVRILLIKALRRIGKGQRILSL